MPHAVGMQRNRASTLALVLKTLDDYRKWGTMGYKQRQRVGDARVRQQAREKSRGSTRPVRPTTGGKESEAMSEAPNMPTNFGE